MQRVTASAHLYTPENCQFSAPLMWSVSLFWNTPEPRDEWFHQLKADLEKDHIRLIEHQFASPTTSQLLVSTLVDAAPSWIVQRTKGRLYYLVKHRKPKPFHGNFAIRSIGNSSRSLTEQYVADQLGHHRMVDEELQLNLGHLQIHNTDVDLSRLVTSSHGAYWYNLHFVFVHRERWNASNMIQLELVQQTLSGLSKNNGIRLAAAGIQTDHIHLLAGCPYSMSPQSIALEYLNALARVWGSKPVYQFGGDVGTVGEYESDWIAMATTQLV